MSCSKGKDEVKPREPVTVADFVAEGIKSGKYVTTPRDGDNTIVVGAPELYTNNTNLVDVTYLIVKRHANLRVSIIATQGIINNAVRIVDVSGGPRGAVEITILCKKSHWL